MNRTLGFSVWLVAHATVAGAAEPARIYTNEDLDRVAPYRDQTGVNQTPAAKQPDEKPAEERSDRRRDEKYWRAEAAKVRTRVRSLSARAAELRLRVEAERRKPRKRSSGETQLLTLEERLRRAEAEIRETEDDLEERARRAGALPGWLR